MSANHTRRFLTGRAASGRRKAQIACVIAVTIVTAASFSVRSAAAEQSVSPSQSLRYRLIDLGTLGGPNSSETQESPFINNTGMVVGFADTALHNPSNPEGFVFHAFRWRRGPLRDLGTLPGGVNSLAVWSNNAGEVVGISENGRIDPLLGIPQGRGVLWRKDGQIVNLGTLGGHESLAAYINNRGQIAGFAANRKRDPFSLFWLGHADTGVFVAQGHHAGPGHAGRPRRACRLRQQPRPSRRLFLHQLERRTRTPGSPPRTRSSGRTARWPTSAPWEAPWASQPPSTTGAKLPAYPTWPEIRLLTPSSGAGESLRTWAPSVGPSAPPPG